MNEPLICEFPTDLGHRVCRAPATHFVFITKEYGRSDTFGDRIESATHTRLECVNHASAECLRNTLVQIMPMEDVEYAS